MNQVKQTKKEIVLTSLTERGLAEKFAEKNEGDVTYNKDVNQWFVWNNTNYVQDNLEFEARFYDFLDSYRKLAKMNVVVKTTDGKYYSIQEFSKFLNSKSTASTAKKIADSARSIKTIISQDRDFDTHKHIIACKDSYYNLKTGKAFKPDPFYKITMCCDVEPSEKPNCPEFQKFLKKIFKTESLINYIQVLLGYMVTGETTVQKIYIYYGDGSNGKSTFQTIVKKTLGEKYAKTSDSKTFLASQVRNIRNDIARLKGARVVISSETPEGEKLDENTVKLLTGGDSVECRFLYKESFEYRPQFKIILATNKLPVIQGTDYGIKRRIEVIPFKTKITESEMDTEMEEKLEEELPGIFRWMIEGAKEWYENGFPECPEVKEATREFWEKKDQIEEFLEDCCEINTDRKTPLQDLYNRYLGWAKSTDYKMLGKKQFGDLMRQKNFVQAKSGSKRNWIGISIIK